MSGVYLFTRSWTLTSLVSRTTTYASSMRTSGYAMNIVNYCLNFLRVLLERDNICSMGQGLLLQHSIAYNMCIFMKEEGTPSFCASQLIFPHLFTLVCRVSPSSLQLALIYIRLLLPKSSKSEGLINLARGSTLEWCPENLAYDTWLAKEAITTYLARNGINWSTEAGDDISFIGLPKEPAMHKKKGCLLQ